VIVAIASDLCAVILTGSTVKTHPLKPLSERNLAVFLSN
jgi:hypothetical protein